MTTRAPNVYRGDCRKHAKATYRFTHATLCTLRQLLDLPTLWLRQLLSLAYRDSYFRVVRVLPVKLICGLLQQIELYEPSKEKPALIVENNLYEFIRMPFLCTAPATFQRVMNYILREVSGMKALVYLDDVIIFSQTFEDHLKDIKEVSTLVKNAGLKLKLKKCQFLKKSVQYLGHIISRDGIGQIQQKSKKIANYIMRVNSNKPSSQTNAILCLPASLILICQ